MLRSPAGCIDLAHVTAAHGAFALAVAERERLRRQFADPDIERVCALLQAHGCGLEQESLLLGTGQRSDLPPR